jgi:small subunit ribosomal protein S25e
VSEKKKPDTEKRRKEPQKKGEEVEKGVLGVVPPSLDEVRDFLKGVRYVTPSLLAERFKLRVSVAKDVLADLVSKGFVKEVVGVNRIRIYQPLTSGPPTQEKAAAPAPEEKKPKKAKKSSKQTSSEPQS